MRPNVSYTNGDTVISEDPALWRDIITDSERIEIVRTGPVQIRNFNYPQNIDNPPRRFTIENFEMKMKQNQMKKEETKERSKIKTTIGRTQSKYHPFRYRSITSFNEKQIFVCLFVFLFFIFFYFKIY